MTGQEIEQPWQSPGDLSSTRVAIFGLGLMGGSLALALRGKCASVTGYDIDPATRQAALERQVVDQAAASPVEALAQVDLLILAVPVKGILAHLGELPAWTDRPLVVMDLGSTKQAITAAMLSLPENFAPVPGHPMCGKETNGLDHAEPLLYRDAPFALVSLERTPAEAKSLAEALVWAVGARPTWLPPAAHDQMVAHTSHLPYILSAALALCTPQAVTPLIGPGFRSTSRLAGSNPRMMRDILATNRENVLAALAQFQAALDKIKDSLTGEMHPVEDILQEAQNHYRTLLANPGAGLPGKPGFAQEGRS